MTGKFLAGKYKIIDVVGKGGMGNITCLFRTKHP